MIATRIIQTALATGTTAGTVFAAGDNQWGQLGTNPPGESLAFDETIRTSGHLITAVAAGGFHSLALTDYGWVFAWGLNAHGGVGVGKNIYSTDTMSRVPRLDGVIAIAAGFGHSLALLANGGVQAWGLNDYGQLGDGTTTDRYSPREVPGLTDIIAIAAGGYHSLALRSNGRIMAWGRNDYGGLGDGTSGNSSRPIFTKDLQNVMVIAAGLGHSLAILADGTVWAWGANGYGQLGDDTTTDRLIPKQVASSAIAVAGGEYHSLVLLPGGTVLASGVNGNYELGSDTYPQTYRPSFAEVLVPGPGDKKRPLRGVIAIAAGHSHNVALLSDCRAQVWGDNELGQLGNGMNVKICAPGAVKIPDTAGGVVAISAGAQHTLLLCKGRSPWQWGFIGPALAVSFPSGPPAVKAIAIGAAHGQALLVRGNSLLGGWVWTWGDNTDGQLGRGGDPDVPAPVEGGLRDVVAIASGNAHCLAVTYAGTVWAWGRNLNGQLGDNQTISRATPRQIEPAPGQGSFTVTAIAAGASHSLALSIKGKVWAWGANDRGQLGDGTNIERHLPVLVHNLDNVVAIAAGDAHSLALRADGTVWAWGANDDGQLGNNTTTSSPVPVQPLWMLPGLVGSIFDGFKAISAGGAHSLALHTTGQVYAWGRNTHGQVGDGSVGGNRLAAVRVAWGGTAPAPIPWDLKTTHVKSIAAGSQHSLALLAEAGLVYGWGANSSLELGLDSSADKPVPDTAVRAIIPVPDWPDAQQLVTMFTITAISTGNGRSLAIGADFLPVTSAD
jgi:alpha-tubulin suppressor-like RCC1 family protein